MYTESDLLSISNQLRRRLYVLSAPTFLLLAGIVVSLLPAIRLQWLTVTLTICLGLVIIGGCGLFIAPLAAYRRHINNALYGRSHKVEVLFKSLKQEPCLKEGVTFYPMLVSEGDLANEKDDRLFYFDIEKPLPHFKPGSSLTITYHDKFIIDLKAN
ncbi:MAG: hypothetical protein IJ461_03520 [Clostridia bacterium]|nr:hypothetical protein [Clostridia bacterium]